MSDKLKNIEDKLIKLTENEFHYVRSELNPIPFILLDLCREVIKLKQEVAREPRNWGNLHT